MLTRTSIHAALSGSTICSAAGQVAIGHTPVLALCRQLIAAGFDPSIPLEVYRGNILALRIRSIGEAAALMVRAFEAAMWEFGVDPDSIFAMKLRTALNISTAYLQEYRGLARAPRRRFACEQCGAETIAYNLRQKFCSPKCRGAAQKAVTAP